ncbi:bifunctional anthranilate synthase component I family protein/class IV aminotransferase [soil metagenome]
MSNSPTHSPLSGIDCFALLDDLDAVKEDPRSRLYTGHVDTLSCDSAAGLSALLENMQAATLHGRHAVALFSYELGAALHDIEPHESRQALAEVLLFERCQHLSSAQVETWLAERELALQESSASVDQSLRAPSGVAGVRASIDETDFNDAMARIHAYLEAGDTYQINFTYRLRFDAFGSPLALYRRLRQRQPVPFGALLNLPDGRVVLSLSPEQFVRHAGGIATARPMKGTAAATGDAARDAVIASALAADPKNRAENLMIVDLLRNDLGRIAIPGSVKVPALFDVNRFGAVLQMTSTVQARLRDDVSLHDMLLAVYPCGSITGAPKRRSMQIIRELEGDTRGIYTGAIGWFEAPASENRIGDFCLSVPIRTMMLQAPGVDGVRAGEMGIGAGIVHDSVAADEYLECKLKGRFLTGLPNDFELIETMHATWTEGIRHLDAHLQRLRASSEYFGFNLDDTKMRALLRKACASLPDSRPHRLRLTLNQAGNCDLQIGELHPVSEPVRLLISSEAVRADDLFLRHKTSVRARYDAAWRKAESAGAFDTLFFNQLGELTEGARSSVFVKLNGEWHTPPLQSGLLPGVMRSQLLHDSAWNAVERRLTLKDLQSAEDLVVCNALRGVLRAVVDFSGSGIASENG